MKSPLSDNEIIAQFMGYSEEIQKGDAWCRDFDWNWSALMPVVEKIYEINDEEELKAIREINNEGLAIFELGIATPINEVYKAVVEFIKWYNDSKKV